MIVLSSYEISVVLHDLQSIQITKLKEQHNCVRKMESLRTAIADREAATQTYTQGLASLNAAARMIALNSTGDLSTRKEQLFEIRKYAESISRTQKNNENHIEVLRRVAGEVNSMQKEAEVRADGGQQAKFDSTTIKRNYKKYILELEEAAEEICTEVRVIDNFIRGLQLYGGGDEQLIAIGNEIVPKLCPITKKEMADPYVNVQCNHMYSMIGLLHMFTQEHSWRCADWTKVEDIPTALEVKCPVIGCSGSVSRTILQRSSIIDMNSATMQESSILDVPSQSQY